MARPLLSLYAIAFDVEKEKLISLPVGNLNSDIRERFLPQRLLEQIFQNASDNQKPISTTIERPEPKKMGRPVGSYKVQEGTQAERLEKHEAEILAAMKVKRQKRLKRFPQRVRDSYENLPANWPVLMHNPFFGFRTYGGKLAYPSAGHHRMDIRASALKAGFAEEDLSGECLEHYFRLLNEGSWDSGSTLATLRGGVGAFKGMLDANEMDISPRAIFTRYTTSFQNRY